MSMEASTAGDAANTGPWLLTSVAGEAILASKSIKHGLQIDPLAVGVAVVTNLVDLNAFLMEHYQFLVGFLFTLLRY